MAGGRGQIREFGNRNASSRQEWVMDSLSDADIIARSMRDPDVFAALFERHFESVYAYLARRVGADIGGDLTADVFLAAFESRRRYDLSRPMSRPWLLGIATNLAHRHWRTERLRLASITKIAPSGTADTEDETVDRVDAAAVASEVSAAVASLDAGCRDVLLLVAWADLSYAEAAEALDIPIGTYRCTQGHGAVVGLQSYEPTIPRSYEGTSPRSYEATKLRVYEPTTLRLYEPTIPRSYVRFHQIGRNRTQRFDSYWITGCWTY
jgi:RNA polymerase sigma factor (sigma-70 family)